MDHLDDICHYTTTNVSPWDFVFSKFSRNNLVMVLFTWDRTQTTTYRNLTWKCTWLQKLDTMMDEPKLWTFKGRENGCLAEVTSTGKMDMERELELHWQMYMNDIMAVKLETQPRTKMELWHRALEQQAASVLGTWTQRTNNTVTVSKGTRHHRDEQVRGIQRNWRICK